MIAKNNTNPDNSFYSAIKIGVSCFIVRFNSASLIETHDLRVMSIVSTIPIIINSYKIDVSAWFSDLTSHI